MKTLLPILLQLLIASGLIGGAIALRGEFPALFQLTLAVLALYLTALFDWYAFFSRLTHTGKRTKLVAGIISALLFVLVWIWLIVIVWRQTGA